jgi:hypothetical protein
MDTVFMDTVFMDTVFMDTAAMVGATDTVRQSALRTSTGSARTSASPY